MTILTKIRLLTRLISFAIDTPKERYELNEEITLAIKTKDQGLYPDEEEALQFYLKRKPIPKNCLLIGAGAGREAFVLAAHGISVTAVEPVTQMIPPKSHHQVRFINLSFEEYHQAFLEEKYDLIWVTRNLISFYGKKEREAFIKAILEHKKAEGEIVFLADIMPLSPKHKYFWLSLYLKFKLSDWEEGDTLRFDLGGGIAHRLIYYHYFPDQKSIQAQWQQSKVKVEFFNSGFARVFSE